MQKLQRYIQKEENYTNIDEYNRLFDKILKEELNSIAVDDQGNEIKVYQNLLDNTDSVSFNKFEFKDANGNPYHYSEAQINENGWLKMYEKDGLDISVKVFKDNKNNNIYIVKNGQNYYQSKNFENTIKTLTRTLIHNMHSVEGAQNLGFGLTVSNRIHETATSGWNEFVKAIEKNKVTKNGNGKFTLNGAQLTEYTEEVKENGQPISTQTLAVIKKVRMGKMLKQNTSQYRRVKHGKIPI